MEKHVFENEIQKSSLDDIGNCLEDFEILQSLGKRDYGIVLKVKSRKNQKIYVMKEIDLNLINDKNEIETLLNTNFELLNLQSPHLVKYYKIFKINQKIYIIMEYMANGNLKNYIQGYLDMHKAIEELEIWEFLYQCLSGICILHKNYFIHRDIKPSNLFLTDNKKIKIGDFINSVKRKKEGNSHSMQKETKMVGTPFGSRIILSSTIRQ